MAAKRADLLRSLASQLVELLRNEAAVPHEHADPLEAQTRNCLATISKALQDGGFEMAGTWTEGASNWAMDYPRSDRHFARCRRFLRERQSPAHPPRRAP